MRSNTLRLVVTVLAALAAAGCKKEGVEGPQAVCRPVSSVCGADADCCSYGCVLGSCRQNPLEGGACRTTDDCQYPRVCVDQKCTSSVACRPGATSCVYGTDCCSGQCLAGACANDLPPTAVIRVGGVSVETLPNQPFTVPIALDGNASTDPNTGATGLVYAWSVLSAPAGSTAAPSTPTLSTTSFTPDVASATTPYVLQLKVTKGGSEGVDTITFYAVNTPPAITMPADVQAPVYQSRNVPLTTKATVTDADGGPITCSWTKTSPTGTVTEISPATTCASASGQAATGNSTPPDLTEDQEGIWILTLTASDGVNTVTKTRSVNVQNDPPVANAGPKRWGNYRLGAIPVDGTATDLNGDVTGGNVGDAEFTWYWEVTAKPAGSSLALPYHDAAWTTPSITFTPDAEGLYKLTLTVDDHEGGTSPHSDTATVDVQVEPYILPLGEVADAEYVEGSNRIVVVETDAASAYKLKIIDPASLLTAPQEVTLAARPTCVGLNVNAPSGTEAIVGETGGAWQRITGIQSTPAVATTAPAGALIADLVDVVDAGTCAYGLVGSGTVYRLFPLGDGPTGTPYAGAVSCPSCTTGTDDPLGTRTTSNAADIWFLQTTTGRMGRYAIHTNCNLVPPGTLTKPVVRTDGSLAGAAGLWLSADGADLYSTRSTVYNSADLTARTTTPLPITSDHLETTLMTSSLVLAAAQYSSTSLSTFSRLGPGTPFGSVAAKPLPVLGYNGDAVWNYGRYAFVSTTGAYYAIVRANVGTAAAPIYRWGVVNLGP